MQPVQFTFDVILTFLGQLLLAIVILFVGRFLARRAQPVVDRFLHLPRVAEPLGRTMVNFFSRTAYWIILGGAILLAALVLGVPFRLIATSAGVIVVVVTVALRESLANFTATLIFFVYEPFRKGELVQTMGFTGIVSEIQLFNTVLQLADKRRVSLPNQQIQESGVVNFSRSGILRADIDCVVAYDADLALVRRVLLTIGLSEPRALPEPPVEVVFVEMGDNGMRVSLRLFAREADYWSVLSDLRSRVKSALDEAGIGFAETKYVLSGNEMQPKKDPV